MTEHLTSPAQTINHERSITDHKGVKPQLVGTMTGAALRFDGWPSVNGTVNFGFNWPAIHAGSHVYVSASEIDNAGSRANGSAPYTVQNVVVKEGRVEFRIAIGWNSPLRVSTDILTIDP
ncbi:MAG: hypothetical protein DLM68_10555 [Hyphomicrobiales bacterium]|nr:MAG: hypothetical protein DLM68_10555 [Hyphomicrobiales bacterium]